jgi:hypothetical protein
VCLFSDYSCHLFLHLIADSLSANANDCLSNDGLSIGSLSTTNYDDGL